MTKTLVLGLVLAAFSVLTFEAIATYGYVGYFEALLSNLPGIHVSADVFIALTLVFIWMSIDARERSLPFWRYAILGLLFGSVGPLAYLIHREVRGRIHLCRLEPGALASAHEWLSFYERFWTSRLDVLERLLREEDARQSPSPKKGDDK